MAPRDILDSWGKGKIGSRPLDGRVYPGSIPGDLIPGTLSPDLAGNLEVAAMFFFDDCVHIFRCHKGTTSDQLFQFVCSRLKLIDKMPLWEIVPILSSDNADDIAEMFEVYHLKFFSGGKVGDLEVLTDLQVLVHTEEKPWHKGRIGISIKRIDILDALQDESLKRQILEKNNFFPCCHKNYEYPWQTLNADAWASDCRMAGDQVSKVIGICNASERFISFKGWKFVTPQGEVDYSDLNFDYAIAILDVEGQRASTIPSPKIPYAGDWNGVSSFSRSICSGNYSFGASFSGEVEEVIACATTGEVIKFYRVVSESAECHFWHGKISKSISYKKGDCISKYKHEYFLAWEDSVQYVDRSALVDSIGRW